MRILGIDPGESPGYAIGSGSRLIVRALGGLALPAVEYVRCQIPPGDGGRTIDVVATEGQWFSPGKRRNPKSIATLGFDAGRRVGQAAERFRATDVQLDVETWKGRLFRGGGRLEKFVFCERIRAMLVPVVWVGSSWTDNLTSIQVLDLTEDELDAIGIMWGAYLEINDPTPAKPKARKTPLKKKRPPGRVLS